MIKVLLRISMMLFGVSKKTFKKAVGDLYKKRLVVLEAEGIRPHLVELFPTGYRKSPMNLWGKSIVGESDFPLFLCHRTNKLKNGTAMKRWTTLLIVICMLGITIPRNGGP